MGFANTEQFLIADNIKEHSTFFTPHFCLLKYHYYSSIHRSGKNLKCELLLRVFSGRNSWIILNLFLLKYIDYGSFVSQPVTHFQILWLFFSRISQYIFFIHIIEIQNVYMLSCVFLFKYFSFYFNFFCVFHIEYIFFLISLMHFYANVFSIGSIAYFFFCTIY